ncbi:MAG: hypothetical protein U0103_21335 [Candidatus Obscuribacterales bacterium]
MLFIGSCQAQVSDGLLGGDEELIRQLNLAAGAMRSYRNIFRTYYQFAIAVDPSIRSLPIINGQYKPPNSWVAPTHTVVIFSDGQNQFAAWVAGQDGKPINDPTTHVPLIIYETIDPDAAKTSS